MVKSSIYGVDLVFEDNKLVEVLPNRDDIKVEYNPPVIILVNTENGSVIKFNIETHEAELQGRIEDLFEILDIANTIVFKVENAGKVNIEVDGDSIPILITDENYLRKIMSKDPKQAIKKAYDMFEIAVEDILEDRDECMPEDSDPLDYLPFTVRVGIDNNREDIGAVEFTFECNDDMKLIPILILYPFGIDIDNIDDRKLIVRPRKFSRNTFYIGALATEYGDCKAGKLIVELKNDDGETIEKIEHDVNFEYLEDIL